MPILANLKLIAHAARASMRHAFEGKARPWRVWWLGGIPVGLAASSLTLAGELLREADYHGGGALLDTAKVFVYALWLLAAWRCARNIERPVLRGVARAGVAGLLLLAAITA